MPLAVVALLAGAGAVLGVASGSTPSDGTAKRISVALSALEEPGRSDDSDSRRGGAQHYRRIVRKRVPPPAAAEFLPLHRAAARRYAVSWRLLASIHRQETAFSTASTTYHGLNAFGCCAGPMQFNVTNGPVSTWKLYRDASRGAPRPKRYPHRTRHHPSVYDDFDAIMAAASLLRDSGAGRALDERAWWAAYSYYGHDLYGVTYANEVLARAVAWKRHGFCANCPLDPHLVAKFERAYGKSLRRQLLADERRDKQRKRRKRARSEREKRAKRERQRRKRDDAKRRATRRGPAREHPSKPPRAQSTTPAQPSAAAPAPTAATPPAAQAPAPPPAPAPCSPVRELLGRCPP